MGSLFLTAQLNGVPVLIGLN